MGGYLYNWYAATAGTGTYAQSTDGTNVTGNICPANFRLPSGSSDGSTATGSGTSAVAADFPVLNASMNAGALAAGATTSSYYAGWLPSGAWGGTYSGYWDDGLVGQGSLGYFWASTARAATYARGASFNLDYVGPGNTTYDKYRGYTVRCVMQ
ncbi:MAG: hypothetical protein ACK5MU_04825 [Candidatus Saccharimonadales bacterium]